MQIPSVGLGSIFYSCSGSSFTCIQWCHVSPRQLPFHGHVLHWQPSRYSHRKPSRFGGGRSLLTGILRSVSLSCPAHDAPFESKGIQQIRARVSIALHKLTGVWVGNAVFCTPPFQAGGFGVNSERLGSATQHLADLIEGQISLPVIKPATIKRLPTSSAARPDRVSV